LTTGTFSTALNKALEQLQMDSNMHSFKIAAATSAQAGISDSHVKPSADGKVMTITTGYQNLSHCLGTRK